MSTLEIKLFGTLRVQQPGQPMVRFPTRRVKDLFSFLLLNRHTLHSRETLAELFWDGAKDGNSRRCLNTALWRLNRALSEVAPGDHPFLRIDAQHIGFNTASDCRLDIAEFESRCLYAAELGTSSPEQQKALYQQAIALYQGDLLVDCYEEWCLIERDRLQRMYLRALDFLIGYYADRGEYAAGIDCATRLLACDPLREDVHRRAIDFYLAAGQPAAALRQYQACQTVLARELGTEPAPATRSLLPEVFRQACLTPGAAFSGDTPRPTTADDAPPTVSSGMTRPAEPANDLPAALVQLRQAIAELERAHIQLREAAHSVEGLAQRLLTSPQAATVEAQRRLASPQAATAEAERILATTPVTTRESRRPARL
jgi:DNA-binding SARP family transcriptional activator